LIYFYLCRKTHASKRRVLLIKAMERRVCWNNIKISISPARCFVYTLRAVCFILGKKQQPMCTRTTGSVEKSLNSYKSHSTVRARSGAQPPKIVKQKRRNSSDFWLRREISQRDEQSAQREVPADASQHTMQPGVLLQKRFILFPLSLSKLKQKGASSFSRLTRSFQSAGIISSNLIAYNGSEYKCFR
jgi:hypothetical protein